MSSENYLKKIAIVGAGGNSGASTLKHLLAINPNISITLVSRADSSTQFPSSPQITIKRGSYDDPEFLISAFKGHELAMFCLNVAGTETQPKLIDAAAKAGVKYIVPNEYSLDGKHEGFAKMAIFAPKGKAREQILGLGMRFIAPVTGPWTETSVNAGLFGIDVANRQATLYSGGGEFNSSSMNRIGEAIARVLSLPITSEESPRRSLQHYENGFIYITSYLVTQEKVFESVKKATRTSDSDWKIEHQSMADRMRIGQEHMDAGNFWQGLAGVAYSYYMGEGMPGNFAAQAREEMEVLGLKDEDLDAVVKGAVSSA